MAFLNFVLPFFNKANRIMQSVKPIIWKKSSPMNELVKKLLLCFKNRGYVRKTTLASIDPNLDVQSRPLNRILIGREAHKYLRRDRRTLMPVQKLKILKNIKNFLRVASFDLKKRINSDDLGTTHRNFMHPANALSRSFHSSHSNLDEVFITYPLNILDEKIKKDINDEWEALLEHQFTPEYANASVEVFWGELRKCRDENGQPLFENLCNFSISLMLLSNSNASAERLWSQLNLKKTKIRNKLGFDTLKALLLSASYIADLGGIANFEATDEMVIEAYKKLFKRKKKNNKKRKRSDEKYNSSKAKKPKNSVQDSCDSQRQKNNSAPTSPGNKDSQPTGSSETSDGGEKKFRVKFK